MKIQNNTTMRKKFGFFENNYRSKVEIPVDRLNETFVNGDTSLFFWFFLKIFLLLNNEMCNLSL